MTWISQRKLNKQLAEMWRKGYQCGKAHYRLFGPHEEPQVSQERCELELSHDQ